MSKLDIRLSYKNACILKHSLRDKVIKKQEKLFRDGLTETGNMTYEERLEMRKELEEGKRALEAMTEEIDRNMKKHGR